MTSKEQARAVADAVWAKMQDSSNDFWNPRRVIAYVAELEMFEEAISWNLGETALDIVYAEHPDRVEKVTGSRASYVALPEPKGFKPCRSTQHCAYHGWCQRCVPYFSAIMSDVNRAISDTGVDDTFRGPLYDKIAKVLLPYLFDRK